jgi:hypothetical protein
MACRRRFLSRSRMGTQARGASLGIGLRTLDENRYGVDTYPVMVCEPYPAGPTALNVDHRFWYVTL